MLFLCFLSDNNYFLFFHRHPAAGGNKCPIGPRPKRMKNRSPPQKLGVPTFRYIRNRHSAICVMYTRIIQYHNNVHLNSTCCYYYMRPPEITRIRSDIFAKKKQYYNRSTFSATKPIRIARPHNIIIHNIDIGFLRARAFTHYVKSILIRYFS